MILRISSCMLYLFVFIFSLPAIADVWYVDKDNHSGVEDGMSWQTAFTTIQPAVDTAKADGGGEVWVAEGNYNEVRNGVLYDEVATGSLMVHENASLYGGFAGDETERDARAPALHKSIIDGSTSLSGEPAACVVFLDATTTIDGFTITGGYARSIDPHNSLGRSGAAILTARKKDNINISNCIFENNKSDGTGAVVSFLSIVEVRKCIFRNNSALGAERDASFYDCVFENNKGAYVGGSTNWSPMFVRCIFRGNHAVEGGALRLTNGSHVSNCLFVSNTAEEQGGALRLNNGTDAQTGGWIGSHDISHCTFVNNQAPEGPTVYLYGLLYIENNLISSAENELVTVEQGEYHWFGSLFNGDPHFADPENGDYRLMPDSPAIDSNDLENTDPEFVLLDLAGTARPINEKYDFGAYEYDPEADSDGDGLTNNTEWTTYHTHPYKADTDGDHVPDGLEIQYGTDPLDPSSTPPILPLAAGAALTGLLLVALWRARRMKQQM